MLSSKNLPQEEVIKSIKKQNGKILKLIQVSSLAIGLLLSNGGFAKAENNGLRIGNEATSEESNKKIQVIKEKMTLINSINLTERQEAFIKDAIIRHEVNKELGNIPDFYKIEIKKIQIKSLLDYEQIIDGGSNMKDIAVKQMNLNNFDEIMDSLFDTSDAEEWIKNPDGTKLDIEELTSYKYKVFIQSIQIKRTILSYDDNIKLQFLNEWFKLFNDGVNKSISKSREVQRLILTSSFALLSNKYPTQEMRKIKKEEVVDMFNYIITQAGRYEVLTSNGSTSGLQISIEVAGITTYFFVVGGDTLKKYNINGEKYFEIIHSYILDIDNTMQEIKNIFRNKTKGTEV